METDKTITCKDCDRDFVFSADEQRYFAAKNLPNDPKRCPECRVINRHTRAGKAIEDLADVICSECNRSTVVPFQPRGYAPIYCTRCLAERREHAAKLCSRLAEVQDACG